jgi:hypothetical protein
MHFARILTRLPIMESNDWRIIPSVSALVAMAAAIPKAKNLAAFRPIGLRRWERQRKRLVAATRGDRVALARPALQEVRGLMIDALAREGFLRPRKLRKDHLRPLQIAARLAQPIGIREKQRREQSAMDRAVASLADLLAGIYHRLTGEAPAPRRVFYRLVGDVFDVLGVGRNHAAAARAAAQRWRNKHPTARAS